MKTTLGRFEVSSPICGVIDHVSSKHKVNLVARAFCIRNEVDYVEVYDRMARRGQVELWKLIVSPCLQGQGENFVWEGIVRKRIDSVTVGGGL